MNKRIETLVGLAATAALLVSCSGYKSTNPKQAPNATAMNSAVEPDVQTVMVGQTITLKVKAKQLNSVQWLKNGVPIAGQTQRVLVLKNVQLSDAGVYAGNISPESGPPSIVGTTVLQVQEVSIKGLITVSAPPTPTPGTNGSCPGRFAGYVAFSKALPNWGWHPTAGTNFHTICDTNRSDTKLQVTGRSGDSFCSNTCVTITGNPPASTAYKFTVYFPNNVPTSYYTVQLDGFDP